MPSRPIMEQPCFPASSPPKFCLGPIVATSNALSAITHEDILRALDRHIRGDWGELDDFDRNQNEEALIHGRRLLSVYYAQNDTRFYVITEADRSATTILLPEDY